MINVLIVIYNSTIKNSETYRTIKDYKNINIIICDNSTKDYGNLEYAKGITNITYLNMGGNVGLSKAYNEGLKLIEKNNQDIVCLFDDDSIIPENYFEIISQKAKNLDTKMFMPLVYDQMGLMSPNLMIGNYLHRAKSTNHNIKELSAINSGLVIRTDVFKNYSYDENLFLDCVDHNFIRDMRKKDVKMEVVEEIKLEQNFSSFTDNQKSAEIRFQIFKKDLKYFYKDSYYYYLYIIARHRLRLCLTYKTFKFFYL